MMRRERRSPEALSRDATFVAWIDEHRGIVVKVARSFAATPDDLDDLIQEILIKVWASVDAFEGTAKPSTWIYRVALHRALTWRRDDAKHRHKRHPLIELGEIRDRSGASSADSEHSLNHLYAQLRKLAEVDRALVLLSIEGFSYREMAEITDMSESNVGARLTRARTKLQDLLGEQAHD